MSTKPRAPRGPRAPVTRETPELPEGEASAPTLVVEEHGDIEVSDGASAPAGGVPAVSLDEPYDGRWMVCRKPFKLNGKKYVAGDEVPVDLIPRPESWVRTGFLREAS